MSTTKDGDEHAFVHLSVQGVYFAAKKDFVVNQPWLLSKATTSQIPWEEQSSTGQYYVDVDPSSFRAILSILKGVTDLADVVKKCTGPELATLEATARYLLLEDIASKIG